MDPLLCSDLAAATRGRLEAVDLSSACSRICTDSREIQPGDVFWALRGPRFDGHDFACDALDRGAQLVVCATERAAQIAAPRLIVADTLAAFGQFAQWYRLRQDALVICVTGSVGKTTTKDLIHAALGRQFLGVRSPGNFNNAVGLPKSLLAIERQHEFAVLELGASRAGEIRALTELAAPEIGAITSIGKAHLASFGDIDGVIRAKGELLESLPPSGFAVLPGDDPLMRAMESRAACRVLFVGEQRNNEVRAERIELTNGGLAFQVDGMPFVVPGAPRHFLVNALIAVAIAREIGVASSVIAAGLQDFRTAEGRCRTFACGCWTVIDDTYNASPASVLAGCEMLLATVATLRSRRYLVLGDMLELGEISAAEHREAGRAAAQSGIDGVLAFGEFAGEVARGASQGGLRSGRIVATGDLDVLLTVLECWLEPGDVVLVKGSRGMRMERVVEWLQRAASLPEHAAGRCA